MLPFAVKVVWFILSITGLVACCIVLKAFSRTVETTWGPLVYCIGCTMLQGIFCLGMVYRINPFLMPRSFCIAQTIIVGYSTFLITGVCGAFSIATSVAVLKPKSWGDDQAALRWQRIYAIPIIIFPVLASAIHIALVILFDSARPTDGMHCDSSHPIWVRFFGYAGMPFLVSIPSLILSIKSAIRIHGTNQHLQRSRHDNITIDNFTPLPRSHRPKLFQLTGHAITAPSDSGTIPRTRREPLSPSITSPVLSSRKFHLPFATSPSPPNNHESSFAESGQDTDADSTVSSSFPTFAIPDRPPSNAAIITSSPTPTSPNGRPEPDEIRVATAGDDKLSAMDWKYDDDLDVISRKSIYDLSKEEDDPESELRMSTPSKSPGAGYKRRTLPPRSLAPAIFRLILFQFLFFSVQVLMCVSTLIDVTGRRPHPSPLETQHFALLFAVWGPVIIFGHLPAVRRNLPVLRSAVR